MKLVWEICAPRRRNIVKPPHLRYLRPLVDMFNEVILEEDYVFYVNRAKDTF